MDMALGVRLDQVSFKCSREKLAGRHPLSVSKPARICFLGLSFFLSFFVFRSNWDDWPRKSRRVWFQSWAGAAQKLRVEKRPKAVIFSVNSTGPNILRAIKLIYNIVSATLSRRFAISLS